VAGDAEARVDAGLGGVAAAEAGPVQPRQPAVADREPVARGTVYELRRKCGKPSCCCATEGQLHAVTVLSVSEEGRTRLRTIPPDQIAAVRALTAQYQRFRRARARLVKVHRQMVTVIDQLAAARQQQR
jgi:hypothetical protein